MLPGERPAMPGTSPRPRRPTPWQMAHWMVLPLAGLDQRLAFGEAAGRHVGDERRVRVAVLDAFEVLRDFDDAVADRLGAAVGMLQAPAALEERTRHGVGFDHLGPAQHRQRGEVGDRGAHFVVGQTLGDVDHGQRRLCLCARRCGSRRAGAPDTPRWHRADASSPDGRGRSADGSRCRRAPSCRCRARQPAAFADARPETSPADASDRRSVSACRPWCCRRHAWAGRHRAAASPCPAGRAETPSWDGRPPPPRPEAMPAMQARRHYA